MSDPTDDDRRWLDAAVRFARPYLGTTRGHPAVGALVLADEVAVARSVATVAGALAQAGAAAAGATLYLTLEPTEDDVEIIVRRDVARVVIGIPQPGRVLQGRGTAALAEADVDCSVADHEPSAALHAAYIHRVTRNRPLTSLILAVSADGMVAGRDGKRVDVGPEAVRWRAEQRAFADAVMAGANTAMADDPDLDVTIAGLEDRPLARVIAVGSRQLRPDLRITDPQGDKPIYVLASEENARELRHRGTPIGLPSRNGRPDLTKGMAALAEHHISSMLIETGAKLTEAALAAEIVDRVHLIETHAQVGRGGLSATVLGRFDGRLRAAGFVETADETLGADRLRSFELRL